jgi:hypothetical protein
MQLDLLKIVISANNLFIYTITMHGVRFNMNMNMNMNIKQQVIVSKTIKSPQGPTLSRPSFSKIDTSRQIQNRGCGCGK